MGVLVPALPLRYFPQRGEMTCSDYMVTWSSFSLWQFIIQPHRKFNHCLCAVVGHFVPLDSHEKCTDGSAVHLDSLICVNIQAFFKKLFILETLVVVVVFMNDCMPIVSFLACLMVSQMLHIHFVKSLPMVDKHCQKSPTLIFLLCLPFVLFLWL